MNTINWQKLAEDYQEELFKDLQQWIQIPSVGEVDADSKNYPTGKANREALDFFLALGEKNGFISKNVDNVVGHIEYENGQEIVGVIGHSDVVPVSDDWDDHPFSGKIENGFMYGRGTQDDKGPMMASFYALKILKDLGLPLSKTIRLINGTDEESGMLSVNTYFAKEQMPDIGFSPDSDFPLIYGEKGILTFQIAIKEDKPSSLLTFFAGMRPNMVPSEATASIKSQLDIITLFNTFLSNNNYFGKAIKETPDTFTLSIEGKSAHGSTPDAGVNAAFLLVTFLNSVSIDNHFLTFFNKYLLNDTTGEKLGFNFVGEMGPLTSNVAMIEFKDGQAHITINIRYPHEWDIETQKQKLLSLLEEQQASLASFVFKAPLYIPKEDPLIQTLKEVYQKQTGDDTPLLTTGGGTYARSMKKAVAYGMLFPNTEDRMHQKNERVPLDDLIKATAIYAEALYELAK